MDFILINLSSMCSDSDRPTTRGRGVIAAKKISHDGQEPLAARVHLTRILIRKHVYLILVA